MSQSNPNRRWTKPARASAIALAAGLLAAAPAHAGVVWNELTGSPDLSNDRLAPTQIPLSVGHNLITSVVNFTDKDYFTVIVPAGASLTSIILNSYDSPDAIAFLAFQPGSIFTQDADQPDPLQINGLAFVGPANVGTDLIPDLHAALGFPTPGFERPLPAGSYTFWFQQIGPDTIAEFDFVVVPGPGAAGLAGLSALALLRRRRA